MDYRVTALSLWNNGKGQLLKLPLTMEECNNTSYIRIRYRGADMSLARPGWKQARKHVTELVSFLVGIRTYQHPCTIKARLFNHCCSGETIRITYYEFVFVVVGTQDAMRVGHIVIYGLPRSTIFFPHYLTNGTIFGNKLLNTKCGFWFSLNFSF